MSEATTELCICGAAPDTGNLGVSALFLSAIAGIASRLPKANVTVFDDGWGVRADRVTFSGIPFEHFRCGIRHSRRYHRPESLWNIRMSGWLRGAGNPASAAISRASAVLDVTGGDSFTDLYGPRRFRQSTLIKQIILEHGTPLILLPQTYGPFAGDKARQTAEAILRQSAMAWARDEQSFQTLRDMVRSDFDPDRHRSGVDLAFGLETCPPPDDVVTFLFGSTGDASPSMVGINISGLIFNDPAGATARYGFKADYREVLTRLIRRLLRETDVRVVLIPHVVTVPSHYESDIAACEAIAGALDNEHDDRIVVLPALADPRQVKWVLSKMIWFCGTRMHSTIGSLSSGVPTAAIAYSMKTAGVFETCDQGQCVVDPRSLDTQEVVERLWACWINRDIAKSRLSMRLPDVLHQATDQMDRILHSCTAGVAVQGQSRF